MTATQLRTPARSSRSLTYFERVLAARRQGDSLALAAFERHVHYGYWADPASADGSVEDFVQAAHALTQRVLAAASARPGTRILDVGCGIGGTLALLNESLGGVELLGLNIDAAQLAEAREVALPRPGNRLELVAGDAIRLPYPDAALDTVLAVECAFHFPSRIAFLHEARRVLRPGGRLALCDFVPTRTMRAGLWMLGGLVERTIAPSFGPWDLSYTAGRYRRAAREAGLRLDVVDDITPGIVPSFPVWLRLIRHLLPERPLMAELFRVWAWLHAVGLMRYVVIGMERPR